LDSQRGHKLGKQGCSRKGGQGGRHGNGGNGEVNLSKRSIKALKSMEHAIKKVGLACDDESADASKDSDGEDKAAKKQKAAKNHDNPALSRKLKNKKK
jgi:hypothetical protein